MESARLACSAGETQVWKPQGHDKGLASELFDRPHCAGKLTYGIPMDLVTPQCGVTQDCYCYILVLSTVLSSIKLISRKQRFSGFRLLVEDCFSVYAQRPIIMNDAASHISSGVISLNRTYRHPNFAVG